MKNLIIVLIIGVPFSLIAATMVFLITYREYEHHFFEKRKVFGMSLESALFTLGFFAALLLIIWLSLNSMFPTT